MQREEIEIEIRPDGKVEYRIVGVKGSACEEISAVLEELGKVEESTRTAEYYDQEPDVHLSIGEA